MDTQLIIWLALTVLIFVARFTSYRVWRTSIAPFGYWKFLWNGKWIKGLPLVWFVLSALIYFIK